MRILLLAAFGATGDAVGGEIFWSDTAADQVYRMSASGTNMQAIVSTGLSSAVDVIVDPGARKVYWVDNDFDRIERANLDGSQRQTVVSSGLVTPVRIDLDTASGKIYWVDNHDFSIRRANLDGSNIETLPHSAQYALAIDPVSRRIYWSDSGIYSASLDDLAMAEFVVPTGGGRVWGIQVDSHGGKLYWGNFDQGHIRRANLDGTAIETLVSGLRGFSELAIDVAGGRLYWTEQNAGLIRGSRLDGSNIETIYSGLPGPSGIAFLVPEPGAATLLLAGLLGLAWRRRPSSGATAKLRS